MRGVLAQARIEVLLTLRRGESLLVVAGIPIAILLFFSAVDVLPHGTQSTVSFLVPGVVALAIISSAMTSLGIATGFERQAGVFKRLGTTPLGRGGLLTAKIAALAIVVLLQVVAVGIVGFALGWRISGSIGAAVAVIALGMIAFAALGFTLAGRLRAETNLAAANGLFLAFLLLGGIVVPVSRLPSSARVIARALPAEALASSLRAALDGVAIPGTSLTVLTAWAIGACVLAVVAFRWD